ncbi:MAG: anhydro-N-acetylmuramic acid kinase [Chitinophagaceae bacterium]|nr:anhydro-N-acetylmuramic acid kinase [Chitinophagaceae bacterium]
MVYRVIGLMSGSSLDGLDIAFVEFHETSGKWNYTLRNAACYAYTQEWINKLRNATSLNAFDYQLLNAEFGYYIGDQVNKFIAENNIQYQVQLIASHGHTTFHSPEHKMTSQVGCGAAIAATTGINVVSDLRAIDVALGGQGAPIVPIGEQLLLSDYQLFLNIGGIANISINHPSKYIAYDVCPANKVLNMLAQNAGKPFDEGGQLAEKGKVINSLLEILNNLEYYRMPYPKSLSNDFGTDVIYPLINNGGYDIHDALRTYVEHICIQVANAASHFPDITNHKMLVTGGGAKNSFLIKRMGELLKEKGVSVEVPIDDLVDFKEAIIMGLIAVLRWREENNVLASVTGASRNSIGGAVWIGQEA